MSHNSPIIHSQQPSIRARLVSDLPADQDAFGSHQEIANAIMELVNSEDGSRAIGLAGKYGAGKSTVVRFLEQACSKDNSKLLWVFDAWSHEGDPLRRSFLQGLLGALRAKSWIDSIEWNRREEFLSRRRKEWTTDSLPTVTPIGWQLALAVLFVPLGTTLLASALRNPGVSTTEFVGVVMSLGPIAVILLHFLLGRDATNEQQWGRVFSLIVHRNASTLQTQVLETPEPTSIEFGAIFDDAVGEALGSDKNRQLIIVVDNLDRIGAADALALWATLQTFLHAPVITEWRRRLWVVMPFDEDAVRLLWSTSEGEGESGGSARLAGAYLDKTFQIRFEVPPPLLSDWKAFTLELLAAAFPGHLSDDRAFEDTFRVFARHRGPDCELPMPRDIKIFVNQLGALYRQPRYARMPLAHLAYYVQQRRSKSVESIVTGLRRNTLIADTDAGFPPRIGPVYS
jgi:hypothetical protein